MLGLGLVLLSEHLLDLRPGLRSLKIVDDAGFLEGKTFGLTVEEEGEADVECQGTEEDSIVSPLDFLDIDSAGTLPNRIEQLTSRAIGVTNWLKDMATF